MIRRGILCRRAVSAAISVLTLGLSLAPPLLERGSFVGLAVESHHDPARCSPGHDHRLCAQMGANLSIVPAVSDHLPDDFAVRVAPPSGASLTPGDASFTGPPSRAPPSA